MKFVRLAEVVVVTTTVVVVTGYAAFGAVASAREASLLS